MNKATSLLIAGALLASTAVGLAETVESDIDGATPGKWTMDFGAAKKLAAEKQLPILLDFSGTDWCGWCKIMEKNVFTKPEWAAYAKDNLVMVLIDFPSDKSLVPEKYAERNAALKAEYGVQGFPTFVVLDDDGKAELGRLRSGEDKTPASFQGELELLFRNRPEAVAKYIASLSPEAQAEYKALNEKMTTAKADKKAAETKLSEFSKQVEELAGTIDGLEDELRGFRAKQLGEEQYKEFTETKAALAAKAKEIQDWLATQPERTEENMAKFRSMQDEQEALASKLKTY